MNLELLKARICRFFAYYWWGLVMMDHAWSPSWRRFQKWDDRVKQLEAK